MTPSPGAHRPTPARVRWVLSRYGWVLAVCVVLLGALAVVAQSRQSPTYIAEALVVAQQLEINNEALPGYAEAVFSSGAVATAVAEQPALSADPESVIPSRLQVLTAPDSVAIKVVGRDRDAQVAAGLANAAAGAYVTELNRGGVGVGVFAVQSLARTPSSPVAGDVTAPVAAFGGVAAGTVLGSALMALLLIVRRPVIGVDDVQALAELPFCTLVELPRDASPALSGARGVPGMVRLTSQVREMAPGVLLVCSAPQDEPDRRLVSVMLATGLLPHHAVELQGDADLVAMLQQHQEHRAGAGPHGRGREGRDRSSIVVVDGAGPDEFARYQDSNRRGLLVVRQGTASRRLRFTLAEFLEGELDGVVLVVPVRQRRSRSDQASTGPGPHLPRGEADEPQPGLAGTSSS